MATYALVSGAEHDFHNKVHEFLQRNSISSPAIYAAPASRFYDDDDEMTKIMMDLNKTTSRHYVLRIKLDNARHFIKAAKKDGLDCIVYRA